MLIGFANYKKAIAAAVIKEGEKLLKAAAVRELDEESKGCYVAYVDEGEQSWDVRLVLNERAELSEHSCDCKSDYFFCAHQVAVFLHLKEKGTTTTGKPLLKKVSKKKKGISLEGIPLQTLEDWLLEVFKSHKYLQEEFSQKFHTQDHEFSAEIIQKQLRAYTKSVLGTKRNMDNSMFKKLLKLRKPYLMQVVEKFDFRLSPEITFNFAEQIFLHQFDVVERTSFNGKNIHESWTEIFECMCTALVKIEKEEDCQGFFAELLKSFNNQTKNYPQDVWISLLLTGLQKMEPPVRKGICRFIDESWSKGMLQKICDTNALMKRVLEKIVQGIEEAEIMLPKLKPLNWELSYNIDLIAEFQKRGDFAKVERFCNLCIDQNVQTSYNLPYLEILQSLYLEQKNTKALLTVQEQILWLDPKIERYQEWFEAVDNPEQIKEFRNKLFAKSRRSGQEFIRFRIFWIELLIFENQIGKVLSELKTQCYVWDLVVSLSTLHHFDEKTTLQIILNASSANRMNDYIEEDEESVVNQLIPIIEDLYDERSIKSGIETIQKENRYFFYYHKPFFSYFLEKYRKV